MILVLLASSNFGTCIHGVSGSTDYSRSSRTMWEEKNRDGELPRFPPVQDLRVTSSSIGEAHEILRKGLQQFLSVQDTDLATYLNYLLFQRVEPFVDEYGQEIHSYQKVFGFIWQQYNETLVENYAVKQFDRDKLYMCSVARFLSHQKAVRDRTTLMKRMGDALGYKCHPCTPYNPRRYGLGNGEEQTTIVPNIDNVSPDGVSPEESVILCKRDKEDGLATKVDDKNQTNFQETLTSSAVDLRNNNNKSCNSSSTNNSPNINHSDLWPTLNNECPVSNLGSVDNPCFTISNFGCYCIVKEQKTHEEADEFCRNNQMQLVWFASQHESEQVVNLMVENGLSGFWTSGIDRDLNRKWQWEQLSSSTSFPIQHFHWCKGEPDNYDGNELYILVKSHPDKIKCWEDAPGHARWPAICKPSLSLPMLLDDLTKVRSQLKDILSELSEQKKMLKRITDQRDPAETSPNIISNTRNFHFHFEN